MRKYEKAVKNNQQKAWKEGAGTGWQVPAVVPWLWQALFAEIHPHPLTHMSVDLHQAAHSSVTYLMTTTHEIVNNFNICWPFLTFSLTQLFLWFIQGLVLWLAQDSSRSFQWINLPLQILLYLKLQCLMLPLGGETCMKCCSLLLQFVSEHELMLSPDTQVKDHTDMKPRISLNINFHDQLIVIN